MIVGHRWARSKTPTNKNKYPSRRNLGNPHETPNEPHDLVTIALSLISQFGYVLYNFFRPPFNETPMINKGLMEPYHLLRKSQHPTGCVKFKWLMQDNSLARYLSVGTPRRWVSPQRETGSQSKVWWCFLQGIGLLLYASLSCPYDILYANQLSSDLLSDWYCSWWLKLLWELFFHDTFWSCNNWSFFEFYWLADICTEFTLIDAW